MWLGIFVVISLCPLENEDPLHRFPPNASCLSHQHMATNEADVDSAAINIQVNNADETQPGLADR